MTLSIESRIKRAWNAARQRGWRADWLGFSRTFLIVAALTLLARLVGGWAFYLSWRGVTESWWTPLVLLAVSVGLPFLWTYLRVLWRIHRKNMLWAVVILPPFLFPFSYCILPFALTFAAFGSWLGNRLSNPESPSQQLKDELHRSYFAQRIATIFAEDNPTIRRVAITGPWGSGKTAVLQLIQQGLTSPDSKALPPFKVAFVNPWSANSPEAGWRIVADGLDEALGITSVEGVGRLGQSLARLMDRVAGSPGISEQVVQLVHEHVAGDVNRAAKINRWLERADCRLVVLVDDMERATDDVIRGMFPLLDQLNSLNRCFFVFAFDRQQIELSFGLGGEGKVVADGFLRKVFDLRFDLPEPILQDVIKMCSSRISSTGTPKLFSVFDTIASLLPDNPRAALRFIDDSKKKELMFLSRFSENDFPVAAFFLAHMADLEFPGVLEKLKEQKHANLFGTVLNSAVLSGDRSKRSQPEKVDQLSENLLHDLGFPLERKGRLAQILTGVIENIPDIFHQEVFGIGPFKIDWVRSGFQRLHELSSPEVEKSTLALKNMNEKREFRDILKATLPSLDFPFISVCFGQTLESLRSEIRGSLDVGRNYSLLSLRKASIGLSALVRQIEIEIDNGSECVEEIKKPEFLRRWVDDIIECPIVSEHVEIVGSIERLRIRVFELAASRLKLAELYHVANHLHDAFQSGFKFMDSESHLSARNGDCDRIRGILFGLIAVKLLKLLRKGDIPGRWMDAGFPPSQGFNFFYNPHRWGAKEGSPGESFIDRLAEQSRNSAATALGICELVKEIFFRSLIRKDGGWELVAALDLITKEATYVQALWRAALNAPEESVERLKRERDRVSNLLPIRDPNGDDGQWLLTTEQFSQTFPLDGQ